MINRANKIFLLFLCFQPGIKLELFSQETSSNQSTNPDLVFHHLNEEDGLSYNISNCFFKDSKGILWIGTYNGFNRFDGSNFIQYKIRKGKNSLTNEAIHSLCEDKDGSIWGCTSNGVFCYIPREDQYKNYQFEHLESPRWFFNLLITKKGDIITTYRDHVYQYNKHKDTFELIVRLSDGIDSLKTMINGKNGMLEDIESNSLWLTTNYGLVKYNLNTKESSNFRTRPNEELFKQRNCSPLARSYSGNLWTYDGDSNELILFSPASSKTIKKISLKNLADFGFVNTLFEDRQNRLWISSWSSKVCLLDLKNEVFTPLVHDPQDKRTIAANLFWCAYQDDDNTVWLGTVAGISKCNPETNIYKQFRLDARIPELKNTSIHKIVEDPTDQSFWLVSRNNLLIHFDPNTNLREVYDLTKAKPNFNGDLPYFVNQLSIYKDDVIISAYSGSWQLKKADHRIIPYQSLPSGYEKFRCNEIFFYGDSIYFNNARELLYWNKKNNQTELFQFSEDSTIPKEGSVISNLRKDRQNKLWMISPGKHLAYLDQNHSLQRINMFQSGMQGDGSIVSIDLDSKNKIWYVFNNIGLYCYDPETRSIKGWNETDGLPGNRLQQLKIDKFDRIWTMMFNKISIYIPESDAFYNFKIPFSEHDVNYYNCMTQRSNGNIIGTIANEMVEFFPNRLFSHQIIDKPQISQIIASGRKIPIWDKEIINLSRDENTVRILFGSYTDIRIIPYEIEYRLSDAEKIWTNAGSRREAMYNNLPSGKYRFEVRTKSKNNQWLSEIEFIEFIIHTPFYKTWWFTLLWVSGLSSLAYYIIRSKAEGIRSINLLKSKAQALEKEKAIVMYENLKQHLNPHFLFNSLTSLSSLIRLDPKRAGDFLDKMSKVYRYILRNKDSETVPLIDELNFVEMYVQLQKTRFENGLIVKQNIPEEILHQRIVPVTLQNLIENAIKHNTADPDFPLLIEIFNEGNYLVVRNNLQKKNFVETSNKQGQLSMISLYHFLSQTPIIIEESIDFYTVKIPLL